jgi:hypothetical protein
MPLSIQAVGNNGTENNHCTCLHNATEKRDGTTWGGSGYLTWTNPNLNGGWASYHRVATAQTSPWRFVEWGWGKTSSGYQAILAYDAGSGGQNVYFSGITAATHQYSHQYDPNTSKYWFYIDGSNYTNINANFSSGTFNAAGGEAGNGVESFNSTKVYDLRYLVRNPNGTFTFASWNGHSNYIDNAPYSNQNIDGNSFYDKP